MKYMLDCEEPITLENLEQPHSPEIRPPPAPHLTSMAKLGPSLEIFRATLLTAL